MAHLNGKIIQVFQGSGFQVCTIEAGQGGPLPFRARSQRSGFILNFSAATAKLVHKGIAPNMKLIE